MRKSPHFGFIIEELMNNFEKNVLQCYKSLHIAGSSGDSGIFLRYIFFIKNILYVWDFTKTYEEISKHYNLGYVKVFYFGKQFIQRITKKYVQARY